MRCPRCHCAMSTVYKTLRVTETKIRRYRSCRHCGKSFSTNETVREKKDDDEDIYIIDDDDTQEGDDDTGD